MDVQPAAAVAEPAQANGEFFEIERKGISDRIFVSEAPVAGVATLADLLPNYNSVIAALTQTMPTTVVEQLSRVWRRLSSFNEKYVHSFGFLHVVKWFLFSVSQCRRRTSKC